MPAAYPSIGREFLCGIFLTSFEDINITIYMTYTQKLINRNSLSAVVEPTKSNPISDKVDNKLNFQQAEEYAKNNTPDFQTVSKYFPVSYELSE
jgi:hypothetical protein